MLWFWHFNLCLYSLFENHHDLVPSSLLVILLFVNSAVIFCMLWKFSSLIAMWSRRLCCVRCQPLERRLENLATCAPIMNLDWRLPSKTKESWLASCRHWSATYSLNDRRWQIRTGTLLNWRPIWKIAQSTWKRR